MKHTKIALFSAIALLSGTYLCGQAREASLIIDKQNHHAVMIQVDQPEKDTRQALMLRLERSGLKEKIRNGVMKYKGVTFSEISPEKLDIFTKVEEGPNNSSVVFMAVSKGYNNFTSGTSDSIITQNVKNFLQSFILDAKNHSDDIGISSQSSDIDQDEKKYQQLLDEQSSVLKKKAALDNRLLEIQNDLNVKRAEIDKKKVILQDAKTQRSKP